MLVEKLKDFLNKLMEDHPDKNSHWESWARRFNLGIDKTTAAAQRALTMNNIRFTEVSGLSDVELFESEVITDQTSKFMPYTVKNHLTKAVVKWCESTVMSGTKKEEAEAEIEMHMISAENLLAFC